MINDDNTVNRFHDTEVYGDGPAPNQEAQGQGKSSGHSSAESLPSHIPSDAASVLEAASDQYGSDLQPHESGQSATLSHDHPETDSAKDKAATRLQAAVRGYQTRRHVEVRAVGDSGMTHVKIKGDSDVFDRVGIKNMNTENGPKELHYLSVPAKGFQGRVIGGDGIYYEAKTKSEREKIYPPTEHSQQSLVTSTSPEAKSHAFINGGYFNMTKAADPKKPDYTPIGETATGKRTLKSLPVPKDYREDYRTLSFDKRSKITSGPVLSKNGQEEFPESKLEGKDGGKYKFDDHDVIKPGVLKHAEHPNPRSGISVPGTTGNGSVGWLQQMRLSKQVPSNDASKNDGKQDAYRLAVGLSGSERGSENTGFTMPEWSTAMARLDRLNKNPGSSLNLDGGSSSALGAVDSEGKQLLDVRQNEHNGESTFIAFSDTPNPSPKLPELKPAKANEDLLSKIRSGLKRGS